MPVVCMKNIGCDAEQLASADDGPAEKCEAFDAVVVSIGARRVNLLPIEEVLVRDEVERNVRSRQL